MAKMELGVELKLQGLFLRDPNKAIQIFEEEFGVALEKSTALMHREVDKRTPRGLTGDLAGATFRELRGSGFNLHGVVANPLTWSVRPERGIPYDPDFRALVEWVRFKLGLDVRQSFAVAKVIRRNLRAQGQKVARWMFRDGFNAGKPKVQPILDKAAARIIERWK